MVSISKWAIIGLGVIAASFFFKEAAATSLTGTLSRTGSAGSDLGSGIQSTLTGVGVGASRLIDPLFSIVDLFGKAGSLFGGSEITTGGGMNQDNNSGGGIASNNIPSSLAGVSASNGGGTSKISWSSGASASVPSLSSAAKGHYRSLGVSVT
tara:strand:- start:606 stop:1064 length:459 start_codon:yes stop_codon:yes gene_type:complete